MFCNVDMVPHSPFPDLNLAYYQGEQAYSDGVSYNDLPYPQESQKFLACRQGFWDARGRVFRRGQKIRLALGLAFWAIVIIVVYIWT